MNNGSMLESQQYDHGHYGPSKWETTLQYNDQHQQKLAVKRTTPKLLSLNPSEGQEGTAITMVLQDLPAQPVKLAFNSLVVDTKQVQSQQQQQDGRVITTTLITTIPSFQTTLSTAYTVPVSVCFFDSNDVIEDTSFVANFTYQLDDDDTANPTQSQQYLQNERKRSYPYLADDYHSPTLNKRAYQANVQNQPCSEPSIISSYDNISYAPYLQPRPGDQNYTPSASSQLLPIEQQSQPYYSPSPFKTVTASPSSTYLQRRKSHRRPGLQNLKSTSHQPSTPVANYQPYPGLINQSNFEFVDNLDTMMQNWTVTERMQGRRLVRFWREDGPEALIQCGCLPILQHDAAATDINNTIVSCIYWPEKNDYYITSVDAIYLLESLMKIHFGVEEKNRIRRNLEGFRPVTVAKCKPISAEFFKRVMGFPHPKPRNIEKDIKAFTWKILPYALKKIITKYSVTLSATSDIAPALYASSLTSTPQQQQQLYQENDTLPSTHPSMLLPFVSLESSISSDAIATSLSSSSSLSPLPTPPIAMENDILFHHHRHYKHRYQHSHLLNKQQLYYNPTTMTYGCHQEPGVRAAQVRELEPCLQDLSSTNTATTTAPSPPLSSTAPPYSPILLHSEPILYNEMSTSFISATSCDTPSISLPAAIHRRHHPFHSYYTTTSGNNSEFHDIVTSMPAHSSIALPSSTQSSSKYVPQLFINDDSSLV